MSIFFFLSTAVYASVPAHTLHINTHVILVIKVNFYASVAILTDGYSLKNFDNSCFPRI